MARPLAKCGTESAYNRHVRRGEPVDDACRKANAEVARKKRKKYAEEHGKAPQTLANETKKKRADEAAAETSLKYDKSKHVTTLEETLVVLREALVAVAVSAPEKIVSITREIRAYEAEIERLTSVEEEKAVKEEDEFGAFFGDNIARFPGAKAG